MNLQAAVEAHEFQALASALGPALQQHFRLEVDSPFLTGENQELLKDGRRAEICYVMHSGNPADGVLLQIKTFYPPTAFRLPTGGIQVGDEVLATLHREIMEETGLTVGDGEAQVQIERFLGVASYEFVHRSLGKTFPFASYVFLVRMPRSAVLQPTDPTEQIGGWLWKPAPELRGVADVLANVGQSNPEWADWGRFRSLIHQFTSAALAV
jgi:8-oxo-dGTP pyrophosphatase MutT (NUDIX family)